MIPETIDQLLRFLVGDRASGQVAYERNSSARLSIVPSGFFNAPYMPADNPLLLDGLPVPFGTPQVDKQGDRIIVHADVIALAFFMLSRYEEILRPTVRDSHGRFPGRESWAFRNGFIELPIIDAWGRWLRNQCRQAGIPTDEEQTGFSKVFLTHDIDIPFGKHSLRKLLWQTLRIHDRRYTFPWMLKVDDVAIGRLGRAKCEAIYFLLPGCRPTATDYGYLDDSRFPPLLELLRSHSSTVGLHVSYTGGGVPSSVKVEAETLAEKLGGAVRYARYHYLRLTNPSDLQGLEAAGITDDFSLAYADTVGFRAGTCRPFNWIDPRTGKVGKIRIHPLTVMDATLTDPKYMNLSTEDAFSAVVRILSMVREYGGEAVLLTHNDRLTTRTSRRMYSRILESL